MKVFSSKFLAVTSTSLLLLTACGGSSDDGAGQISSFQVSPAEVELQSDIAPAPGVNPCPLAKMGDFAIIGGAAPYTVLSPFHQLITFGPAGSAAPTHMGSYTVSNRNGQFAIYVEGCFDPGTVTILDDLKRVATIEVSYAASAAN